MKIFFWQTRIVFVTKNKNSYFFRLKSYLILNFYLEIILYLVLLFSQNPNTNSFPNLSVVSCIPAFSFITPLNVLLQSHRLSYFFCLFYIFLPLTLLINSLRLSPFSFSFSFSYVFLLITNLIFLLLRFVSDPLIRPQSSVRSSFEYFKGSYCYHSLSTN